MEEQEVDRRLYREVEIAPSGERIILNLQPGENQADFDFSLPSKEQQRWVHTPLVATKRPERGDLSCDGEEWSA